MFCDIQWRVGVGVGVFCLAFGVWRLAFGVWRLAFGFKFLVFGFWFLVFGFWFLVFGFNAVDLDLPESSIPFSKSCQRLAEAPWMARRALPHLSLIHISEPTRPY